MPEGNKEWEESGKQNSPFRAVACSEDPGAAQAKIRVGHRAQYRRIHQRRPYLGGRVAPARVAGVCEFDRLLSE